MANELKFLIAGQDQTQSMYQAHIATIKQAAEAHRQFAEAAEKSKRATEGHAAASEQANRRSADPDPEGEGIEKKTTRLQKLGHTAKEAAESVASIWAANELSEQTIGRYVEAERAFLSLKQTLGVTSEAFGEVREQVEGLAKVTLGETNESIAKVFETAKQLGAEGTEGPAAFAKVVAEMANTTGISANRIAQSMGMILQASGAGTEGAKRFGDVFEDLSHKTLGGGEALLATTQAIQGVASGFHISAEEMLAVASAGTQLGVDGERFGMAFTQSLLGMQHAADDGGLALNDLSQNMGLTNNQFRELLRTNPTEAFIRFASVLQHTTAQGKSLKDELNAIGIGGRNIEAALRATYEHLPKFNELVARSRNPGANDGTLERDNAEVMQTVSAAEKNLRDSAHNLFEGVGAAFAPTLIPMVEALTAAVNTVAAVFNALPGPVRTAAASFLLIVPSIVAAQKALALFLEIGEGTTNALTRAGGMLGLIVRSAKEAAVVEGEMTEATAAAGEAATANAEATGASAAANEAAAAAATQAAEAYSLASIQMSRAAKAAGENTAAALAQEAQASSMARTGAVSMAENIGVLSSEAAVMTSGMGKAAIAIEDVGKAVEGAAVDAVEAGGAFAAAGSVIARALSIVGGPAATLGLVATTGALYELYEQWDALLKLVNESPQQITTNFLDWLATPLPDLNAGLDQTIAKLKESYTLLQRQNTPGAKPLTQEERERAGSVDPLNSAVVNFGSTLRDKGLGAAAQGAHDDFVAFLKQLWTQPLSGAKEGAEEGHRRTQEELETAARGETNRPIIVRDPRLMSLDDTVKRQADLDATQDSLNSLRSQAGRDGGAGGYSKEQLETLQRIIDLKKAELDPSFKVTITQQQQLAAARALTKTEQDRVALAKALQDLTISNPKMTEAQLGDFARRGQQIQVEEINKAYEEEARSLENARQKAGAMTTLETQRLEVQQRLEGYVRRSGYSDEQVANTRAILEATNAITNAREQEQRLNSTGQAGRDYNDQLSILRQRTSAGGDLANNPAQAGREQRSLFYSTLSARDPYAAQLQSARELTNQLSVVGDYQEADRKTLEFVNQEYQKGIDLTQAQVSTLTQVNRQTEDIQRAQSGGFQGWANSLGTLQNSLNSIETSFASGIAGTIYSSIGRMRNRFAFRDFFKDLSGKVFEQAVDQTIKGAMQTTGLISSSGTTGQASASIFDKVLGIHTSTSSTPLGALNTAQMHVQAAQVMINGAMATSAGGTMPAGGVASAGGTYPGSLNVPIGRTSGSGYTPIDVSSGTAGSIDLLKKFEGFRANAHMDVNRYRVGYGSDTITDPLTGAVRTVQKGDSVDANAAEADLHRRVIQTQSGIAGAVGADNWAKMSPSEQAGLTSMAYNYGRLPSNVAAAARTGSVDDIAAAIRSHSGDNNGVNAARREQEAQLVSQQQLAAATRATSAALQSHSQATSMAASNTSTAATAQNNLSTAASQASTQVNSAATALKTVTTGTGIAGSPSSGTTLSTDQSTMLNAGLGNVAGLASHMFNMPAIGSLFPWVSKLFSGFSFHTGGLVGEGGAPIQIPGWMLHGAPRYHDGLNDDEFPAVLQQGERVMTAQQNAMATRVISGVANGPNGSPNTGSGNMPIGDVHIHQTVNPTGNPQADQAAADAHAKAMKSALNQAMHEWAQNAQRPGGALSHASVRGGQH